MERSKYFNYTRPTATQLNNTEDSRARAILRRLDSACQMGIVSGFRVTVNAIDPTRIDIGVGAGYTGGKYTSINVNDDGSGERISTTGSSSTIIGQALADSTAGIKNYVSLVYSETESDPLAEIFFPFDAHNTLVSEDFTVSVLTETNWNALTVNQKRTRILVAVVTATGGALTSSDIQQVVQPLDHPTPSAASNVTGVTFSGIAQTTLIGDGTLRYEAATKRLFWTAPGDAEGSGVVFTSSGSAVLYSNNTIYWIQVTVLYSNLPIGDETDTIVISSLYGTTIPRFSAKDTVHRDMLGSGTPTVTNPHGMTLDDIDDGTLDHADLFHKNGISSEADPTQLSCSANNATNAAEVLNLGGYANTFLIDGHTYRTIDGYAEGVTASVFFTVGDPSGDYLIYLDSAGALNKVRIASYIEGGAGDLVVLFDAAITILDIHNTTTGAATLSWNSTTRFLQYTSPAYAAGPLVKVFPLTNAGNAANGIYKVYADGGIDWIIVQITNMTHGTDSSTFTVNKNETDHADEGILKLAVITWNVTGQLPGNVRDIRQFVTSDIKDIFFEEHDSDGRHTLPLQNGVHIYSTREALQVSASSGAIMAKATAQLGIYASAPVYAASVTASASALLCTASDSVAIDCSASSLALNVKATLNALSVTASNSYAAQIGAASDYGVVANAGRDYALWAAAGRDYGVYASATRSYAISANAKSDYGVKALATLNYGVYGEASNYGVYGTASQYAGYFKADGNAGGVTFTGAVGSCANAGAGDKAIGVYGVAGAGASGTGVVGVGKVGVWGSGNIGGIFSATTGTGVCAYASAGTAGYFVATTGNAGVNITVLNSSAVPIYGAFVSANNSQDAAGNTAYGVYAVAAVPGTDATAIGVYGRASSFGCILSGSLEVPGTTTAPAAGVAISAQANYFLSWDGRLVTPGADLNNIAIPVIIRSGAVTETHAIRLAAFSTTSWQTWGG